MTKRLCIKKMATIALIWIISLITLVKTGLTPIPDGDFHRLDVCADASPSLSCGHNQSMIVQDVQYGTKLTTVCSQSKKSDGCCSYVQTDCFIPFSSKVVGESCSGKILCNVSEIAATDSSICGVDQYPILSHYLTTVFKCIPDARIGQSSSASLNDTGQLLYLQNTDYPAKVRSAEHSSTCSVETRSCSSKVKVYFIHFELADGSGQCTDTQQIRIEDRDINRTYTCSNNTNYAITMAFTSSSNYLKIEFKNRDGVNDGYFWLGFEETDKSALLTLDCPSVSQTICMALGSDCTTEADCSAAVSGSTCNNSLCVCPEGMIEQAGGCVTVEGETKEEPDDGLSVAVIIIIAAAAVVVLIAIIAVVICCIIIKMICRHAGSNGGIFFDSCDFCDSCDSSDSCDCFDCWDSD